MLYPKTQLDVFRSALQAMKAWVPDVVAIGSQFVDSAAEQVGIDDASLFGLGPAQTVARAAQRYSQDVASPTEQVGRFREAQRAQEQAIRQERKDPGVIEEFGIQARAFARQAQQDPAGAISHITDLVVRSAPMTAATMAATAIGGPGAGLAVGAAIESGNMLLEADADGVTTGREFASALAAGTLAGALDMVGSTGMLRMLRGTATAAGLPAAQLGTFTRIARSSLMQKAKEGVKEPVTEVLQEVINNTAAKLNWDPDREVMANTFDAALAAIGQAGATSVLSPSSGDGAATELPVPAQSMSQQLENPVVEEAMLQDPEAAFDALRSGTADQSIEQAAEELDVSMGGDRRGRNFTTGERDILNGLPGTVRGQAMEKVRGDIQKFDEQQIGPDGQRWARIEVDAVEVGTDKKGQPKAEVTYKKIPYTFQDSGMTEEQVATRLAEEYRKLETRASQADPVANAILAERTWYRGMRTRLVERYGGLGGLFADLLGATSPKTAVALNWKSAEEALEVYTKGGYDGVLRQFDEHVRAGGTISNYKGPLPLKQGIQPGMTPDSKYGSNSRNVLLALYNMWREGLTKPGTAPKARNFTGNLAGTSDAATIDVWAARLMQRLTGQRRIPPPAEGAVQGDILKTTLKPGGQFGFAQRAFELAGKELQLEPDELQAVMWFAEKEIWDANGWTTEAGGSFEVMDRESPSDRFIVGLSNQHGPITTTRDEVTQARSIERFAKPLIDIVRGNPLVRAINFHPTIGEYEPGTRESSVGFEVVATPDFDATDFAIETMRRGQQARQMDTFVARRVDKASSEQFAYPGLTLMFRQATDMAGAKDVMDALQAKGLYGFTAVSDPRMPQGMILGLRHIVVPEISARFDKDARSEMAADADAWVQQAEGRIDSVIDMLNGRDDIAVAVPEYYDVLVAGTYQDSDGSTKDTYDAVVASLEDRRGQNAGSAAATGGAGTWGRSRSESITDRIERLGRAGEADSGDVSRPADEVAPADAPAGVDPARGPPGTAPGIDGKPVTTAAARSNRDLAAFARDLRKGVESLLRGAVGRDAGDAGRTGRVQTSAPAGTNPIARVYHRAVTSNRPVSFVGMPIRSGDDGHADLATLAQIDRDPRWEKQSWVFVVDGKVVHHERFTSRTPNRVKATPVPSSQWTGWMGSKLQMVAAQHRVDTGAVEVFLVHNHPHADPTPSSADQAFTSAVARRVKGFRGHIVTDHGTYAVIGPDGTVSKHDLGLTEADPIYGTRDIDNPILGADVNSDADAAAIGNRIREQGYQVGNGTVLLVAVAPKRNAAGTLTGGTVKVVSQVSEREAADGRWLATLRGFGRGEGAWEVAVVGASDPSLYKKAYGMDMVHYVVDINGQSLKQPDWVRGEDFEMGTDITRPGQDVSGSVPVSDVSRGVVRMDRELAARLKDTVVKDANGTPVVMWHGSPVPGWDTPDLSKANRNDPDANVVGVWFSESRDDADRSGRHPWGRRDAAGAGVRPFFLDIKKPASRRDYLSARSAVDRAISERLEAGIEDHPDGRRLSFAERVTEELQARGFDGYIHIPLRKAVTDEMRRQFADEGRAPISDSRWVQRGSDGTIHVYSQSIGHVIGGFGTIEEAIEDGTDPGTVVAFSADQVIPAGAWGEESVEVVSDAARGADREERNGQVDPYEGVGPASRAWNEAQAVREAAGEPSPESLLEADQRAQEAVRQNPDAVERKLYEEGALRGGSQQDVREAIHLNALRTEQAVATNTKKAWKKAVGLHLQYQAAGTEASRTLGARRRLSLMSTPEGRKEAILNAIAEPSKKAKSKIDSALKDKTLENARQAHDAQAKKVEQKEQQVEETRRAIQRSTKEKTGVDLAEEQQALAQAREELKQAQGDAKRQEALRRQIVKRQEKIRAVLEAMPNLDPMREQLARNEEELKAMRKQLGILKMRLTKQQKKVDAIIAQLIEREADMAQRTNKTLLEMGIDVSRLTLDDLKDPNKVAGILRPIGGIKSTLWNMGFEYWINALLSAPTTHVANAFGNAGHAAWDLTAQRFVEAAIAGITGRREGNARFGEIPAAWKQVTMSSVRKAYARAALAFSTEMPHFATEMGFDIRTPVEDVDVNRFAISGKAGRFIRVPTRLLFFADEMAKSLLFDMNLAAFAYRQAHDEALSARQDPTIGGNIDVDARIAQIMADPTSNPAGRQSYDKALEILFQEDLTGNARRFEEFVNRTPIARLIFPFVRTPANIIRTGIRKSPLGSLALLTRLAKGRSDKISMQQVAEQVLAWGTLGVVAGLVGAGDDDEPLITGSQASFRDRGRMEMQRRAGAPQPQSIRIGNRYVSYRRLEPLATMLTPIVDAVYAARAGMRGAGAGKTAGDLFNSVVSTVRDKSFLAGLGDILRAIEDGDNAMQWIGRFASSWSPNILRSAARSADPLFRDARVREGEEDYGWLKDFVEKTTYRSFPFERTPFTQTPPPAVDIYGRDAVKQTGNSVLPRPLSDTVYRMVLPIDQREASPVTFDRVLLNWNNQHPDDAWYPMLPPARLTFNEIEVKLNSEQYYTYVKARGEAALGLLESMHERQPFNVERPSYLDMVRFKAVFDQVSDAGRAAVIREYPEVATRFQEKARELKTRITREQLVPVP